MRILHKGHGAMSMQECDSLLMCALLIYRMHSNYSQTKLLWFSRSGAHPQIFGQQCYVTVKQWTMNEREQLWHVIAIVICYYMWKCIHVLHPFIKLKRRIMENYTIFACPIFVFYVQFLWLYYVGRWSGDSWMLSSWMIWIWIPLRPIWESKCRLAWARAFSKKDRARPQLHVKLSTCLCTCAEGAYRIL